MSPNLQFPADLATFTGEILHGKLRFHKIYACRKNFVILYQLFSPKDYKKNAKIIYKYFKDKYNKA